MVKKRRKNLDKLLTIDGLLKLKCYKQIYMYPLPRKEKIDHNILAILISWKYTGVWLCIYWWSIMYVQIEIRLFFFDSIDSII